jgi:ERCC4-type nuclease
MTVVETFAKNGVICEHRHLPFGFGYAWIARADDGTEVMLDYFLLLKRCEEFYKDLTDGRLKELAVKLGICGISNVVIIVEERKSTESLMLYYEGAPKEKYRRALVDCQVPFLLLLTVF